MSQKETTEYTDPDSGTTSDIPGDSVGPDARRNGVLNLLQDVALRMNQSISIEDALALAIERICRYTGWPVGHAYLLSDESDTLTSSGVFYLGDEDAFAVFRAATQDITFERGEGLPGRILDTGKPHWVLDISADPNFPRAKALVELGLVTAFGSPVLTDSRAVGVLEFFSPKKTEFEQEFVSVATNIGAQVGRVIERERTSEAIRASEERLRALTQSLVEAIITADENGTIMDWSGGAQTLFGYSEEEAVGRNVEIIMPDRHVPAHRHGMARYLSTSKPKLIGHTVEIEAVRKDGTEFPIELSLSTWTNRGDRFFTSVIRDISERRQTDEEIRKGREALEHKEEQLERAQRIAHLGSWEWNVRTGALAWSDELYRIFGIPLDEEVTYEKYASCFHPDDTKAPQQAIQEALVTHEPFSFRHRIVRAGTGEVRVVHSEGEVETDEAGNVVKMFGTALDVTELEHVEEELRESERKFRLLTENMTDLILLQNQDGDLVYVSPSSRRILGYTPEQLQGTNFYDLLEDEDAERLRKGAHGEMLDGKSYTEVLVRSRSSDESLTWIELAGKPIIEDDGSIDLLLTSAREVTERIRAESEAARYRSQLEQRNRELQDFAYVASHDLQEPLRKIRAFSGLIDEDYGDRLGEEGRQFLARVQDAATRMSSLITDLLSFSRVTTSGGTFEETDLNEVLRGVLSDLEIAIKESDAVIEPDELPVLEADPMQMRQLFQNLIGNAIKFAKPDERPVIKVRSRLFNESQRTMSRRRAVCRLEVSDNGIGFEPKYADRIFSPFQRLHNRADVEGTGMGLAICRRIVERHDGSIRVESEPGVGSTFLVELPVRHESEDGT